MKAKYCMIPWGIYIVKLRSTVEWQFQELEEEVKEKLLTNVYKISVKQRE